MKRIVAIICIFILISLTVGCSKNGNPNVNNSEISDEDMTKEAKTDKELNKEAANRVKKTDEKSIRNLNHMIWKRLRRSFCKAIWNLLSASLRH